MKTKLLNIVAKSGITIKSQKHLIDYIEFCLKNNTNTKIKGQTEYHHILPKADDLFEEYSDLRKNFWNGVHLSFENHYIAHSMLVDALDHPKVIYAWNRMNKHFTIEAQTKLIGPQKYEELRNKHRKEVIKYNQTREISDKQREKMSNAQKGFVQATNKLTGEKIRVSKEEFDANENLVGNTPGMVTVLDTRDGKRKSVTKEEYEYNNFYQHNTKGMVAAIDIRDNSRVQVTKEEYEKSDFLVGMGAKKISIFDEKGNLKHSLPLPNFKNNKEWKKFPIRRFTDSAINNGKPIHFTFARKCDESLLRNKGWLEYEGWFAISESY